MKYDIVQLNKKVEKLEAIISNMQNNISDLRIKRVEDDGDIKARLRVMEAHHRDLEAVVTGSKK